MNDLIRELSKLLRLVMTPLRELQKSAEFDSKLKLSEILENLIQAQGIVMDIQGRFQESQDSIEELGRKIEQLQQWSEDAAHYEPFRLKTHCTVMVRKEDGESGYAKDWYCKHCFDNKRKSILQSKSWYQFFCPECKTEYIINQEESDAMERHR